MLLRDGQVTELAAENMVLGVSPEESYQQSVVDLKKGDLLLLYTDGLADGMNYQQQMFGRQRIVGAFRRGGETAEVVAQNILWELRKFVGMNQRTDDVTMIVARVK
jgi:sigma-B regulation protein RsbU (phosphoserine phosphatase)